jgi:hypothetical protein
MYPAIIKVTPHDDYKLTVVFENGECGQLDVKPLLDFGIFQRIRDYHAFQRVRVSFDTIEWDCGVDLDPEYVYAKCMGEKMWVKAQA